MLYICDGAPKSGSTFLFNLIRKTLISKNQIDPKGCLDNCLDNIKTIDNHKLFVKQLSLNDDNTQIIERDISKKFVLKTHLFEKINLSCKYHIFCSVRDPFDNALSLYEEYLKCRSQPEGRFKEMKNLSICLNSNLNYLKLLHKRYLHKNISIYVYPDFINPSNNICNDILRSLNLSDQLTIADIKAITHEIDFLSRNKKLFTEFNVGSVGRGKDFMELFTTSQIDEAYELFEQTKKIAIS